MEVLINKDAIKAFDWINRIIKSCTNTVQLELCGGLIDRYSELYGKDNNHSELLCTYLIMQAGIEIK